ncbi:MAG: hypothetical protein ACO32I_07890 [Candidatus Limnocylindrus sp.]
MASLEAALEAARATRQFAANHGVATIPAESEETGALLVAASAAADAYAVAAADAKRTLQLLQRAVDRARADGDEEAQAKVEAALLAAAVTGRAALVAAAVTAEAKARAARAVVDDMQV